jgi:hypothetical protein
MGRPESPLAPKVVELGKTGATVNEIAALTGYTDSGVRNLLNRHGIRRATPRSIERVYGCSMDEAVALNDGARVGEAGSRSSLYRSQRVNALCRGIGWEITFPEWVAVWLESGYWALRGRRRGFYCMARHGDTGPYKVGNVSIQLFEQNAADALNHGGGSGRKPGSGRGWYYMPDPARKNKPYRVCVSRKHVGDFATQAEAEAAYKSAADALIQQQAA